MSFNCVVDEAVRTIRLSATVRGKNLQMKDCLENTLRDALLG